MQSCIRRRLARKELKALKAEARSVNKFKEISYKLENKVFELTQTLQKRTDEKKELQKKLEELEQQVQHWVGRHEESDQRAKQLQVDITTTNAELSRRDALLKAKEDIEKRLEDALTKAVEKEDAIQRLTEELKQRAAQLENHQKLLDAAPTRSADDSVITTLKNEVSSLREQLNRANALNTLSRHGRAEPTSPTFAPGLRLPLQDGPTTNGDAAAPASTGSSLHHRRHSTPGVYNVIQDNRTSADELMVMARRTRDASPRSVSVIYGGDENYRQNGRLDEIYDDPAEEKIRLMMDVKRLDEDVLEGLIRGLKIPNPSTTNPAAVKEILFPSNLISLTTNEMWRYGLIQESERFLANVLQTVQAHVMVRTVTCGGRRRALTSCSVVPWRGLHCSRNFLAFQRPRDALLHLRGRERHVARHWPGRGECYPPLPVVRLREACHGRKTRSGQLGIQYLPHLDVGNQEEAFKDDHTCFDRKSVSSWVHKLRGNRATLQALGFKRRTSFHHGRYPQPPKQSVEESQEFLYGRIGGATSGN